MIPAEDIQEIWESFITAESSTPERAAWLDVFLAAMLAETREGNKINDILSYCLPSDICTFIGCELFADVHRICSFAGDGEDLSPLQNYLMKGRGWRSLVILDVLDVKGLSCSEELANLLISLYPVCLRYKCSSSTKENPFIFSHSLRDHSNVLQSKVLHKRNSRKLDSITSDKGIDPLGPQSNLLGHSPSLQQPSITDCSATSESEFLEDVSLGGGKPSSHPIVKFRPNPMDFDYFTSIVRSEDEAYHGHPELRKYLDELDSQCGRERKGPDDYVNEKIKAALESEVSVLEFSVLSMRLLQTLCDCNGRADNGQLDRCEKIALQVVVFVLENLRTLQFGSDAPGPTLEPHVASRLRVDLCSLLQSALSMSLKCGTLLSVPHDRTLSTVLRLLEDVLKTEEGLTSVETSHGGHQGDDAKGTTQDYVFGLLNCAFLFLHSLLDSHKPGGDEVLELFVDMFCIMEKSLSGSLMERVVLYLSAVQGTSGKGFGETGDDSKSSRLACLVVEEMGSLVARVKQVRLTVALKEGTLGQQQQTPQQLRRRRSARRRQSVGGGQASSKVSSSHHHHLMHHHKTDVFGIPGLILQKSGKEHAMQTPCIASLLFGKLVRLLARDDLGVELRIRAAQVALGCGSCCCFPSSQLLDAVSGALLEGHKQGEPSKGLQAVCFALLERVLYPQLWGCVLSLSQSLVPPPTHLCCLNYTDASSQSLLSLGNMNWRHASSSPEEPVSDLGITFSSLLAQTTTKSFGLVEDRSQWFRLRFYRQLIESQDFKLCRSTLAHLMRVAAIASPKILRELLDMVIFPTFVTAKGDYLRSKCDVAKFRLLSCLTVFSCYLSKCPDFTMAFFDTGLGLEHVMDLIFIPEFSQPCCNVLEEIVLIGMQKMQEDSKVLRPMLSASMQETHSYLVLTRTIEVFSDKLVLPLKGAKFEGSEGMSISVLFQRISKEYAANLGKKSSVADEEATKTQVGGQETTPSTSTNLGKILESVAMGSESCTDVVKYAAMFWNSCANLVLKSELFKEIFSSSVVCSKGFLLLQVMVLNIVGGCGVAGGLQFPLNPCIRLVEAVLIVSLKCLRGEQDTSVGWQVAKRSPGVLEKLRSLVFSLETEPNVKLCHLCEVLIRCATDDCRGRPALMLARKPELPCMRVVAADEALDSLLDEEDEGGGSTLLGCGETRGYVTADEGYDGDVEVPEDEDAEGWEGGREGDPSLQQQPPLLSPASVPCTPGSPWATELVSSWSMQGGGVGGVGRRWCMRCIVHPELCCLAVDLLVHAHQLASKSVAGESSAAVSGGDKPFVEGITQCLQRLAALCRENPVNCIALSKQGVISRLLQGFSQSLEGDDDTGIQQVVLDLFTHLARYSLSSMDLSTYLGFFKTTAPPVGALLAPLSALMAGTRAQPHFIMCFPVEGGKGNEAEAGAGGSPATTPTGSAPAPPPNRKVTSIGLLPIVKHTLPHASSNEENAAIILAKNLHNEHVRSGMLSSVWVLSGVVLPIDTDIGWSPWAHGFSLSMWLQLGCTEPKTKSQNRTQSGSLSLAHGSAASVSSLSSSSSSSRCRSANASITSEWAVIPDPLPVSLDCSPPSSAATSPPLSAADGAAGSSMSWKPMAQHQGSLHLFSIGSEVLTLEAWVNPSSDFLSLKLTRMDGKKFDTLCESTVESCLPVGSWHHLAVNVKDYMLRRKTVVEVTLFINGCREVKVQMSFSGLVMRRAVPTCLLIGHRLSKPPKHSMNSSWFFGNLVLFRGKVFTMERALCLMAMGPNFTHLTDCDAERSHPNFAPLLTSTSLLSAGINWDALFDAGAGNLKVLQDNLLLAYSAENPKFVNVYPLIVTSPGGVVSSLFPGQPGFRVVTMDQRASQQLPLGLQPLCLSSLNLQQYRGLVAAASPLGGFHLFLFLFARMVEVGADEESQAKALSLLLDLMHSDGDFYSQFVNDDCAKLIIRVLSSSLCKAGNHVLKVLLDASCDKSVLHYHSASCKFHIVSQSNAIITQPVLMVAILQAWRGWERYSQEQIQAAKASRGGSVPDDDECGLGLFFGILLTLLRDDHPHREFNAAQLNRVGMVEAILLFCKERFLLDDSPCSLGSPSVCCSLVEVIRSLMGAPPEFSHIVALSDFLILVHRASATFVSHARSSFYFLPSPKAPTATNGSIPANAGGGRGSSMPQTTVASSVSAVNTAAIYRLNHGLKTEPASGLSAREGWSEKETHLAQPVDPQKLSKALANLQIKQIGDGGDGSMKALSPDCDLIVDSNKVADDGSSGVSPSSGRNPMIVEKMGEENREAREAKTISENFVGSPDKGASQDNAVNLVKTLDSHDNKIISDSDVNFEHCEEKDVPKTLPIKTEWEEEKTSSEGDSSSGMEQEQQSDGKIGEVGSSGQTPSVSDVVAPQPIIIEGLLLLLRDTVLVLPDSMSHQVLNYVVQAESLLVMANHADSRVRTAVVKVISAYLLRAGDEEANHFLRARGFHLLANQLGQFEATPDLVVACISLVTRCSASLEEQVEQQHLLTSLSSAATGKVKGEGADGQARTSLGCLQLAAFPPLLALLPKAIKGDALLPHNLMLFLRETYAKVPHASRPLLESGLLEALAKTLVAIAHSYSQCEDPVEKMASQHSDLDLLVNDVHLFLVTVVSHSVSSTGAHNMQIMNDIQHLLNFVESLEKGSCGPKALCVQVLHEAHLAVLNGAIDAIQVRMASSQGVAQQHHQHHAQFKVQRSISSALSSDFIETVLSTSYDDCHLMEGHTTLSSSSLTSGAYSSPYAISDTNLSYSKPPGPSKDLPKSEINERFRLLLQKSVDFLINTEPTDGRYEVSKSELNFSRFVLSLIIQGLATVLEKTTRGKNRNIIGSGTWHGSQYPRSSSSASGESSMWHFAWASRDCLRIQAGRLLAFLLSPCQPIAQRIHTLYALSEEHNGREILAMVLQTHPQVEHRLTVFCQDVVHHARSGGGGDVAERAEALGIPAASVLPAANGTPGNGPCQPIGPGHPLWDEEVSLLQEEMHKQRVQWQKQNEGAQLRSVHKFEGLAKSITESALDVTRIVVDAQNVERKTFMEHVKLVYSTDIQIKTKWQDIVRQFTHERAVWFFPKSYPRSWQLDPTEGPGRMRIRLQRCHLAIQKKFLMKDHQDKLDAFSQPPPLSYLFVQEKKSCRPHGSSVLIERLLMDEKIRHNCPACIVAPAVEIPGEILVGESSLYFVADEGGSTAGGKGADKKRGSGKGSDRKRASSSLGPDSVHPPLSSSSMVWPLEDVLGVYNRRFRLQERALEIFLINGKTYLIAFASSQERDSFVAELSRCQLPNQLPSDNLSSVMQMWREGLITNYEYLTQLNKMSGRSFNDLMQYPVFPFILADYTSQTLDLQDTKVYRNLKKPMAVQEKKNEQHYVRHYNYLKEELQDVFNSISLNQEPYHYGSHYSNSGTVLHFLVRLPPFTGMFLNYQDKNFDIPDRTFHSLQTTWRLTSTDSTSDVKELIPEFFFLPEFLRNSEGFNFGIRQCGERVDDVYLPPWCEGDPRKFVLVNRQALESDHVREHIHHWIDLVFGYKQTGRAAVDAINVFHPATYYGFDVESILDPLEREAWETMINTYGQTPRQLFRSAHPMVVQTLLSKASSINTPNVLPFVRGLQWGSYVGSPADPPPRVVWRQQHRNTVATLIPLITNDVFGLAPLTSILLCYGKSKSMSMLNTPCVQGAALVTWGHSDGIVRIKLRKEQPPWPVIRSSNLDPIWICGSVPDCCQLWVGHSSGKVVVYKYNFSPLKGQLDFGRPPVILQGHSAGVLSLCINRSFSIVVTASQDGTAIIWDLNNLAYVRDIPGEGVPVKLVSVSETLGDIATVSDAPGGSSCIRLYSVNARPLGRVEVGKGLQVTSLCFSTAPEGISVNAVVAGLSSGIIRLWSTWDLCLIREIACDMLTKPIISIAYSHDSQHLYASSADGCVVIWEAAGSKGGISKTPKFLNLTSL
ncbi:lysosomal-trafficking regulator isoform X2 [Ischnura elegans]|uniref:lysosomal-trafficking regulator isoform X2 n=1 Tax=Ischnura elegans TaxID=197161 RepID=UPI001ED8B0F3|nr:lysosomal-trafficking regulator isoform X2 [Ischnura elegans]